MKSVAWTVLIMAILRIILLPLIWGKWIHVDWSTLVPLSLMLCLLIPICGRILEWW